VIVYELPIGAICCPGAAMCSQLVLHD
jgi:hypothetical protein